MGRVPHDSLISTITYTLYRGPFCINGLFRINNNLVINYTVNTRVGLWSTTRNYRCLRGSKVEKSGRGSGGVKKKDGGGHGLDFRIERNLAEVDKRVKGGRATMGGGCVSVCKRTPCESESLTLEGRVRKRFKCTLTPPLDLSKPPVVRTLCLKVSLVSF